jgi:hypothetical protein
MIRQLFTTFATPCREARGCHFWQSVDSKLVHSQKLARMPSVLPTAAQCILLKHARQRDGRLSCALTLPTKTFELDTLTAQLLAKRRSQTTQPQSFDPAGFTASRRRPPKTAAGHEVKQHSGVINDML